MPYLSLQFSLLFISRQRTCPLQFFDHLLSQGSVIKFRSTIISYLPQGIGQFWKAYYLTRFIPCPRDWVSYQQSERQKYPYLYLNGNCAEIITSKRRMKQERVLKYSQHSVISLRYTQCNMPLFDGIKYVMWC